MNEYSTTGVKDIGGSPPLYSDRRLSGSHRFENNGSPRVKYARQNQYVKLMQQFGATLLGLPPKNSTRTRSRVEKLDLLDAVSRLEDRRRS